MGDPNCDQYSLGRISMSTTLLIHKHRDNNSTDLRSPFPSITYFIEKLTAERKETTTKYWTMELTKVEEIENFYQSLENNEEKFPRG